MRKIFTLIAAALLSVTAVNADVLFEGETVVGNWTPSYEISLASSTILQKATEGCIIAITVSAVAKDESDPENLQIPSIAIQNAGWRDMAGCGKYDITPGVYTFVLSKANIDTITTTGGIIIRGSYFTYTKVELLYPKELWSGSLGGNADWTQSDALSNSIFADLNAGDYLSISYDNLTDTLKNEWGHACVLRINYETNIIDHWTNVAGVCVHKLSANDVDNLQNQTVNLVARWLVINSLNTYTDTKGGGSAIDEVCQPQGQSQKFFKDGQLFILRDDKTYTIQGQLVK